MSEKKPKKVITNPNVKGKEIKKLNSKSKVKGKEIKKDPVIKISKKKRKECKGNKECLTGKKKKIGINDIYSKKDGFGFFVKAPKTSPFTQKDFKPKCGGIIKYKKYKDTKPNPKTFGMLLPKLNNPALYFPRQSNSKCYDDGKKLKKRVSYRPMGLGKERNVSVF